MLQSAVVHSTYLTDKGPTYPQALQVGQHYFRAEGGRILIGTLVARSVDNDGNGMYVHDVAVWRDPFAWLVPAIQAYFPKN